jgi:hypothetical protein
MENKQILKLLAASTLLKCACYHLLAESIADFPHFVSPLNSPREVQETLFMYKTQGKFYAHENQVGQSEVLLLAMYHLSSILPLELILAVIDFGSTCTQLWLVGMVKPPRVRWVQMICIFNPCSVLGGGIANIGAFNDMLWITMLGLMYRGRSGLTGLCFLGAICAYFDPRILILVYPLQVFSARLKGENDVLKPIVCQLCA